MGGFCADDTCGDRDFCIDRGDGQKREIEIYLSFMLGCFWFSAGNTIFTRRKLFVIIAV